MSWLQKAIGAFLRPRVIGKARGASLGELKERLERSRDALLPRIMAAKDTAGNREAINHFVGIERWSQSRMRVALGAPFTLDSYRGYRLPGEATLGELQAAFAATRDETIALAQELAAADIDPDLTIRHNDLGELRVAEWLAYVDDHHLRERLRIRT